MRMQAISMVINPAMRDMHPKHKINVTLKGIQMKNKLQWNP